MKKIIILCLGAIMIAQTGYAQSKSGRVAMGFGALYERGLDATLSYEVETKYHNAWEFFANGYIKYAECDNCGHICPESFWHNYQSWGLGIAYKPCVYRGKNHYGSLRLGASGGSDTHEVMGGLHVGYEHSYVMRGGVQLFYQVKADAMFMGEDLFRSGVVLGIKFPVK